MNVFTIALKNIRQRLLSSTLTTLSVALGVMLVVAVLLVSGIVDRAFAQDRIGYDLVVGAKGSPLQMVLATVYRIGPVEEAIPYQVYLDMQDPTKRRYRGVETAIPVAIGDLTEEGGFPIVGTEGVYFETPYAPGENFRMTKGSARMNGPWHAIIGSEVARVNGWTVGSTFKLIHAGDTDHVHDEKFEVVGVLLPTGTPNDRTAFVNLEGFFALDEHNRTPEELRKQWVDYFGEERTRTEFDPVVERYKKEMAAHDHGEHEGHDHHHHHETPDVMKGLSAIFVVTPTDMGESAGDDSDAEEEENRDGELLIGIGLQNRINAGVGMQAVNPIEPMANLKKLIVGNVQTILLGMTIVIILVSGVGIFVSIYNSMSDRRREIAIMRALGAQRGTVFAIILAEAAILCLAGGLLGILLGHGFAIASAPVLEGRGLVVNPLTVEPAELWVLPGMILLAILAGFVPSLTAYRTDVAATLAE